MSFFKNIFKKQPQLQPIDLSLVKTDLHSHLIPGIDDGSKSIDESIVMLKKFKLLGYSKVITTPHIMSDFYKNTPEIILKGLDKLKKAIKTEGVDIQIEAAAEYYLDYHLEELIKSHEILTFGQNHVLFELSFSNEPPKVKDVIFNFQTEGYKPIMAHVERYPFYFNQFDTIKDFKNRGCLIQLNINSLSGQYGPQVKKMGEQLIDMNLVDVIGSDCHHIGHLDLLESTLTNPYLHQVVNKTDLLNKQL
jgi:tyrosine-protein phosphatase YwqE